MSKKVVLLGESYGKVFGAEINQTVGDDGKVYIKIGFVKISKPCEQQKIKGKAEFWNKKSPEELIEWGKEKYGVSDLYEIASKFMNDTEIDIEDIFKPTEIHGIKVSVDNYPEYPSVNNEIMELFERVLCKYSTENKPLSTFWIDYINNTLKDMSGDVEAFKKYESILV
jgi:hypothetical protein